MPPPVPCRTEPSMQHAGSNILLSFNKLNTNALTVHHPDNNCPLFQSHIPAFTFYVLLPWQHRYDTEEDMMLRCAQLQHHILAVMSVNLSKQTSLTLCDK